MPNAKYPILGNRFDAALARVESVPLSPPEEERPDEGEPSTAMCVLVTSALMDAAQFSKRQIPRHRAAASARALLLAIAQLEADLGMAQASLTMLRDDVAWLKPAVIKWRVKAGQYRRERDAARSANASQAAHLLAQAECIGVDSPSRRAQPMRFNDTDREIL